MSATGISVETPTATRNADGTYTITAAYSNTNGTSETMTTQEIVLAAAGGTADNKTATINSDGTFSFTTGVLTTGTSYVCYARAVSGVVGNIESESITFTAEGPTGNYVNLMGVDSDWSTGLSFTAVNDNDYVLDHTFEAGSSEIKIRENGTDWLGYGTGTGSPVLTANYGLSRTQLWDSDSENLAFNHKAGKYRFYYDMGGNYLSITGVIAATAPLEQLNDNGTYTITVPFVNANGTDESITSVEVSYELQDATTGYWTATLQDDGTYQCTTPYLEKDVNYSIKSLIRTSFMPDGITSDQELSFIAAGSERNQLTTSVDATMGTLTIKSGDVELSAGDISKYVNTDLTITLTPNSGYAATSLTINGTEVEATAGSDGSLTYTYAYPGLELTVGGTLVGNVLSITEGENTSVTVSVTNDDGTTTTLTNGASLTSYIGKTFTIAASSTDAENYRLKSLIINDKEVTYPDHNVTSDEEAFILAATDAGLTVSATAAPFCISHTDMPVASDQPYRCSEGGSAYIKMNVLAGFTYQPMLGTEAHGEAFVCTEAENKHMFAVTAAGTYAMRAIQSNADDCITDMTGSVTISEVSSADLGNDITSSPSGSSTLFPYQLRRFATGNYDVQWGTTTGADYAIVVVNNPNTFAVKYSTAGLGYQVTATLLDELGNTTSCVATENFNITAPGTEICIE